MAVHSTAENGRTKMTEATLISLSHTVNWDRHRLFVIDNGSCAEAKNVFEYAKSLLPFTLVTNEANRGTARAINQAWVHRKPGENVCKIDDDVIWHESHWADRLEDCVEREPRIGIVGLKRKDLHEDPNNPPGDWTHSELRGLPHRPGQRWLVVELVHHVIGTCQLLSSPLLDKIGYLWQPGLYGWDDSLANIRCHVAGFWRCFYPHVEIDHIDPGGTPYQDWKQKHSGEWMGKFDQYQKEYLDGTRPIWVGPED